MTLFDRVSQLAAQDHTRNEIILLCGYFSHNKDGSIKLNVTDFYSDLIKVSNLETVS